jgi:nucleotidyltransferase/DNA polymerase involved in DNA repair
MASELKPLVDKVWRHCEDKEACGRTVTLKVKFADFGRSALDPNESRFSETEHGGLIWIQIQAAASRRRRCTL